MRTRSSAPASYLVFQDCYFLVCNNKPIQMLLLCPCVKLRRTASPTCTPGSDCTPPGKPAFLETSDFEGRGQGSAGELASKIDVEVPKSTEAAAAVPQSIHSAFERPHNSGCGASTQMHTCTHASKGMFGRPGPALHSYEACLGQASGVWIAKPNVAHFSKTAYQRKTSSTCSPKRHIFPRAHGY